jgi:hypothetical protein
MKVIVKRVWVNWLKLHNVRAGELLDVGNILTSPGLVRVVGLSTRT